MKCSFGVVSSIAGKSDRTFSNVLLLERFLLSLASIITTSWAIGLKASWLLLETFKV